MPTIRKRQTKKGVVYDIQIKIKEFATQKYIYKTTTWRPEDSMSSKSEKLACIKFAEQLEKTIKNLYSASKIQALNYNIIIADYAKI